MTFDCFIDKYKNQLIDYDGVSGAQCVDLIKLYLNKCYCIKPGHWGNAKDYWLNTNPELNKFFKKVKNTKTFVPKKGDIGIFTNGTYGHICICTGCGNTKTFSSYDQNYGKNKKIHLVEHDYSGFAGVLRPIYSIVNADANVREKPNGKILFEAPKNSLVKVIKRSGGWAKTSVGYIWEPLLD